MTAASAYSPQSPEPADARPSEPSMEDILASIRRIIADDQSHGGKPAYGNGARRSPAAGSAPSVEGERGVARTRTPYDDVLDLARLVPSAEAQVPRPPAEAPATFAPAHFAPQDAGHDAPDAVDERQAEGAASMPGLRARLPEPTARHTAQEGDADMSDHPVPAVADDDEDDLLSAPLGASVMSTFETLAATVVLQNTPMLERVMRDLLRPMLKTWLDDNLPALVERLVRAEIERVARGTRG